MRSGRLIFLRQKSAPEHRFDAKDIEIISGSEKPPGAFVAAIVTETANDDSINEQPREDVIAIAIIFVIEVGLESEIGAVVQRAVNFDEPRWFLYRQRPQQHSIDQAENCGVGADAKGKRDDSQDCEDGMFEKLTQTIADIMEQRFHVDEMRLLFSSDSKKLASFPERIAFGAATSQRLRL
jgi:hypothetical protein